MKAANIGPGGSEEELVIDFGIGVDVRLWIYHNSGGSASWEWITASSPRYINSVHFVGDTDYELVALIHYLNATYIWDYTGSPGSWIGMWTKIDPYYSFDHSPYDCEPFDPNGLMS